MLRGGKPSVASAAGSGHRPKGGRRPTGAELGSTTWPTIGENLGGAASDDGHRRPRVRCLLIPLGATEQHGPHLPLATDTIIAAAWASAVAARVDGTIVAPPLPYGSSGEHQGFPGTLSIGRDALEHVLTELVRSAALFCDRVILVSGHGGNKPVLEPTVARLIEEGHEVTWIGPEWPDGTEVDAHAGRIETSLLLHLRPELVGSFTEVSGTTEPLSELMPALRTGGLAAVTDNGVLGDPQGANAELGAALFEHLVESLSERLSDGW